MVNKYNSSTQSCRSYVLQIIPTNFIPFLIEALREGSVKIRRIDTFHVWNLAIARGVEDDGKTRTVELMGNGGWKECRIVNNICKDDFVHFQYPGNKVLLMRVYDKNGERKTINPGPNPYLTTGRCTKRDKMMWRKDLKTGVDTYIRHSPHPSFKMLMNKQYTKTGFSVWFICVFILLFCCKLKDAYMSHNICFGLLDLIMYLDYSAAIC